MITEFTHNVGTTFTIYILEIYETVKVFCLKTFIVYSTFGSATVNHHWLVLIQREIGTCRE